jgi:hypothetical protein
VLEGKPRRRDAIEKTLEHGRVRPHHVG